MRYKMVSLHINDNELVTNFIQLPYDREETNTIPHKGGWYYYPETMSDEEALGILKRKLLDEIDSEIAQLSKIRKLLIEKEY